MHESSNSTTDSPSSPLLQLIDLQQNVLRRLIELSQSYDPELRLSDQYQRTTTSRLHELQLLLEFSSTWVQMLQTKLQPDLSTSLPSAPKPSRSECPESSQQPSADGRTPKLNPKNWER